MFDICAVGELLIDFTPTSEGNFKPNPGGAPCNFLTSAQKMGSKTAFIGKVGKDAFGTHLKTVLEEQKIDTNHLKLDEKYGTTLAFVHLYPNGDRDFSFYRKGCADVMLEQNDIDLELLNQTKAFHFGSLSFTDEPSRSTVFTLLKEAKRKALLITYDPNYRAPLWNSKTEAIDYMKKGLAYADIVKVSDEELELLTDEKDFSLGANKLMAFGPKLICVTLGDKGCFYKSAAGLDGLVRGVKANQVDTTGAGDTFFGALISQIVTSGQSLEGIDQATLEAMILTANAAAAICIEGYGGIPSIPTKEAVLKRLEHG